MTVTARDNTNDPTPWAVICPGLTAMQVAAKIASEHPGVVFLTEDQYLSQLTAPGDKWHCPGCGAEAEWDDYCQATNPPEDA